MTTLPILQKSNELSKEENNTDNISIKESPNFKAFNSVLFINEFQEREENSSEKTSKETNELYKSPNIEKEKEKEYFNNIDSYEKCLTNELLNTITNDSSLTKKGNKLNKEMLEKNDVSNSDIKNETNSPKIMKITKNFFIQPNTSSQNQEKIDDLNSNNNNNFIKGKNKNTIYEENTNGFEYQLKFIEDSLHNVLPKSYKKNSYNINYSCYNNNYQYQTNKNNKISTFAIPNKFNDIYDNYESSLYINENNSFNYDSSLYINENNNINYINNFSYVSTFDDSINNNPFYINSTLNNNGYYYNNKKNKYQVHKLKVNNSNFNQWKCYNCNHVNKGYRKACVNCRNNLKA